MELYKKKPLTRVRKLNLWACKLRDSEFMQIMSGVLLLYDVDNAGWGYGWFEEKRVLFP